jgi:hypothetical protein
LPDDAISPKGRRVKCTSCAYTWVQAPAGQDNIEFIQEQISENFVPDTSPKPQPAERPIEHAKSEAVPVVKQAGMGSVMMVAGVIALVLLIASMSFLVATRKNMTASWPALALFYQMIGMPVSAPGADLELTDIDSKLERDMLSVNGTIKNAGTEQQSLAGIVIAVSNNEGRLKEWPVDLNGKLIQPKEEISFQYQLQDVPEGAENVTIRFTE